MQAELLDISDLLRKTQYLFGIDLIVSKKRDGYYLFERSYQDALTCYYLLKKFNTRQELKQYLVDLYTVEDELQK